MDRQQGNGLPTARRTSSLNFILNDQESPPPEPTPPPMATPLMPQMQPMDSSRRPSFNQGNVNMAGMSGAPGGLNYRPTHPMAVPSPSPALHYQHQFVPSARPIPTPTPPLPMHSSQHGIPPMMPSAHVVPQPPVQQAPHFQPHGYNPQQHYTPQPVQPAPVHHPMPSPMPAYDPIQPPPPRPVHHQPMMPTPSRTPMATAPSTSSIPHANVQPHPNQYTANQYTMPRPYEVYRFMDPATEASIPPEIRSQFQRDDQGRLLWFTSAARDRLASKGVAPEYAHLGHSISHLANIGNIREERRRKRKERDEALEKEAEANKRACTEKETSGAEESARAKEAMLVQVLTEFSEEMERGTRLIEEDIAGFREEKAAWDEERKAMKVTEVAKKSAAKEQADEVVED